MLAELALNKHRNMDELVGRHLDAKLEFASICSSLFDRLGLDSWRAIRCWRNLNKLGVMLAQDGDRTLQGADGLKHVLLLAVEPQRRFAEFQRMEIRRSLDCYWSRAVATLPNQR